MSAQCALVVAGGEPEYDAITVAGEPAAMLTYDLTDCFDDHHALLVAVRHGEAGYAIMWLTEKAAPDPGRAEFEEILQTLRFTQ